MDEVPSYEMHPSREPYSAEGRVRKAAADMAKMGHPRASSELYRAVEVMERRRHSVLSAVEAAQGFAQKAAAAERKAGIYHNTMLVQQYQLDQLMNGFRQRIVAALAKRGSSR